MSTSDLEAALRKKTLKRRLICLAVCVVFLAIGVIFLIFLKKYFRELFDLLYGVVFGFAVGFAAGVLLLTDFLAWPYKTFDSNGDYITIYRGFFRTELYIDGELKDYIAVFGYYLEGALKGGAKVHVSIGKWSSRMVFTDGRAPINFTFWFND